MHVITRKRLVAFWTKHADAKDDLADWFKVAAKAKWQKWADVQGAMPRASYYQCCLVFNIAGNNYRLVVRRSENWKTLFVVDVLTHAEYDLDGWKKYCACGSKAKWKEGKHGHKKKGRPKS